MYTKKQCNRVLSFIGKTPWAIKPDALEQIISIANRSYSDPQLAAAIKSEQSLSIESTDNSEIAVIDVFGPIFTRADLFSDISGAASLDSLERRIDEALYDDSIKGIILRIDSPGGEVTGTHEFANYLDEACEIKPIVTYVQGMACSAAYWIASATSHIYVDKTAILGSIGVVAAWTDDSKARSAAGLTDYEVVSSQSPKKRLDPTQDDGRAELQKQLDGLADIFIDDVAAFRDVSRETVLSDFGQGSTFLANDAIKLGMADAVSSLRDVINSLSTKTNNLNHINSGVSQMGIKSNRDRLNFSLKATGKSAEGELDDDDKNGSDDIDDNRKASENDDDTLDASEDDDDDDREPAATKQAIAAFSRKKPNLYNAIVQRGARIERDRIASIEQLNIRGHEKLVHDAKFVQPLTAEQTSYAVLKAEQSIRSKLSDDYTSDASFRVSTSTASVTNNKEAAAKKSFLENVAAGARAVQRRTNA